MENKDNTFACWSHPSPGGLFKEFILLTSHCPFSFQTVDEHYGIDFDGPHPAEEHDGPNSEAASVEVPQIAMPITQGTYEQLSRTINPLRDSEFYGVDIYADVLQIINE